MSRKVSNADFIQEARLKHGNRYDYSQTMYIARKLKVKIICSKHGLFEQIAGNHIVGCGCPKCKGELTSKTQTSTTARFIVRARAVHGEKYDYSQIEYFGSTRPVKIICFKHGAFEQMPAIHLDGSGCTTCGRQKRATKCTSTINDFLIKARAVHGEKYDYSQVIYISSKRPVKIICLQHGLFEQDAGSHTQGTGCPKCWQGPLAASRRLGLNDFLVKARATHGNKYDYSQVEYTSRSSKVKIICPQHGLFEQAVYSHMQGAGCPKCALSRRVSLRTHSLEWFIAKARAVHGDKYDYSQVEYTNSSGKVKIVCPQHGLFEQIANTHVQGGGCMACGREKTIAAVIASKVPTTKELIERARAVHGDKYDYSQTEYKAYPNKIDIICPEHGLFQQVASSHLAGQGCARCAGKTGINHSITSFLQYAIAAHGNKYDYSQVVYTGLENTVLIGCPVHGDFKQVARTHMRGSICPKCSLDRLAAINRSLPPKISLEQWIERAAEIHGSIYDYSLLNLKRLSAKVKIICFKHGEFEQAANMHLEGQGCPKCGRERIAQAARLSWVEQAGNRCCTLYFLRVYNQEEEFFKVGITSHSVEWRYRNRSSLAGYEYEILALHQSQNAAAIYDWEQSILETFSHIRYMPKRPFGGETECFSNEREILSIFPL